MGVYIAPEIKDRVAVGDDLYTITDSGGKKKLTPSPTEVSEPGTEINKALLQPMADALARIDAAAVPYVLYWWRRRAVANGYSETRQTAYSAGVGYSHTLNSENYYYLDAKRYVRYSGEESGTDYYATLSYASSITINQSSGAITLVNPSSYTFSSSDDVNDSSVYSRFQGKYVQGFLGIESKTFYIPSSAYMVTHNWETSGGDRYNEHGYEITSDMWSSTMPILINSTKVTSTGAWETISADTSDAYPHSGESGGYEWVYCGRISDFTPSLYPLGIKTVNITSASWTDGSYTIAMPHSRYMLWCYRDDTYSPSGVVLMVDNGLAYGEYLKITSNGDYLRYVAGNSRITNVSGVTFAFTSTGITLTGSGTLTLAYLPL